MKILMLFYFFLDYNMCSHLPNVNLQNDQKNMVSSLYRQYMTLNNDILKLVDDTQYSNAVLSRKTFQMLESYLLEKLKDTLPVCYDAYIGLLLHDIGQFFMGNQLYPCFQIDNFVFNDILSIQTDNAGIGLLFNFMRESVDKMNNTFNYYNEAEISITKMELQLSSYRNNNFVNHQIKKMRNCYDHLGTSIKTTLTTKNLSVDECGRIYSYKTFLEKLSLEPLTLDKLAGETSFRIQSYPLVTLGYPTDDVVRYLNQISLKNLTNLLANTTDEIQNYTKLLKSQMTDIFNATTIEIEQLIMTYINEQIKDQSKAWCFRGSVENLLKRIKHRYDILKKSCFGSLQEMVRYLELSKCNLRDMEIQLMRQNCQVTRTCEEISLDLTKFRITLSAWKTVDRSHIMDYAKTCYGIANIVVINNVIKYWSKLKRCQLFPFLEGLFHRLPTYKEFYVLDMLSHNSINKYNNIACPQVLK